MTGCWLQGQGNLAEYEAKLTDAEGVQASVLEGVRGTHPDVVASHRQTAADIQTELAVLYSQQHKPKQVLLMPLLLLTGKNISSQGCKLYVTYLLWPSSPSEMLLCLWPRLLL